MGLYMEMSFVIKSSQAVFPMFATRFVEQEVHVHFFKLDEYLKQKGTMFFSGPEPLTADFVVWEYLDQVQVLNKHMKIPPMLDSYPVLTDFWQRFRKISKLEKYFSSEAYSLPCGDATTSFC